MNLAGKKIDAIMKENRLDQAKLTKEEKLKYSLSFGDMVINYDLSLN